MQREDELDIDDPDNPQKALAGLKRVPARSIRGKIVMLAKGVTKFVCPNHPMKTVIELVESDQRSKKNKLIEYECSCGTIYKKEK